MCIYFKTLIKSQLLYLTELKAHFKFQIYRLISRFSSFFIKGAILYLKGILSLESVILVGSSVLFVVYLYIKEVRNLKTLILKKGELK